MKAKGFERLIHSNIKIIIKMEQHLKYEICNLRYNLSAREPLLVTCCDETVCRACWRKAFDQRGLFVCPHKCGL